MSTNTTTLIQEVYFDICDAIENQYFTHGNLPQEFSSVEDWLREQKSKLERIESCLESVT